MLLGTERIDPKPILATLKDFQRDTVDYVVHRLYDDPDSVSKFLVADEVGLGKTLVARGVIASAIDRLWDTIERIDVVYICSNVNIARQNLNRLNITEAREFQFSSRATLLPITLHQLQGHKLNFISFTPGTSFNLRSTGGVKEERWVLYRILREVWDIHDTSFRNLMRGSVKKSNWRAYREGWRRNFNIDEELTSRFLAAVKKRPDLYRGFRDLAEEVGPRRTRLPEEIRVRRDQLTGRLREVLAKSSLSALEPDLVILDEFQRFKYLLDLENPLATLARELFEYPDVRVLMLSATPYKMYTQAWETEDDHYADFYRTAEFLLQERPGDLVRLRAALRDYRNGMLRLGAGGRAEAERAKGEIEDVLRTVMVRTERLAATPDRRGMLEEKHTAQDKMEPQDLEAFVALDKVSRALNVQDQVEFWKSTPYALNLMDDYKLKRTLKDRIDLEDVAGVVTPLRSRHSHLLKWRDVRGYRTVDPNNARLRSLIETAVDDNRWQVLWIPPSLPYYQPSRPFDRLPSAGMTKTLIFSSWRVVPKAVATLASYEVERRVMGAGKVAFAYDQLTRRRKPLLNFTKSKGRLTGLANFCLLYPSPTLARFWDPFVAAQGDSSKPLTQAEMLADAKTSLRRLLKEKQSVLPRGEEDGPADERWYWALPALLDRDNYPEILPGWLDTREPDIDWRSMVRDADGEDGSQTRFADHVDALAEVLEHPDALGPRPSDLVTIVAQMALASPAVVALRSLLRMGDSIELRSPVQLAEAARVGLGFRSLFNQPGSIVLLGSIFKTGSYWQKVLRYAAAGNLQAIMDEYVHILRESLGLVGHPQEEACHKIGVEIDKALSLRAPSLSFDNYKVNAGSVKTETRRLRCRYAMRFGDERSSDGDGSTRDVDVRVAFNSPFRPFILATTSIGQEGLDFHQYCHRVVHWNLPSNPVDLEQREGRIHRYKGHVVRRNLANHYGLDGLDRTTRNLADPWQALFDQAVSDRGEDASDLVPFWLYEIPDGYKIERVVPMLPMSREEEKLIWLKRSLVTYRSVMGQPRQEELLEYLERQLDEDDLRDLSTLLAIDLSPPPRRMSE